MSRNAVAVTLLGVTVVVSSVVAADAAPRQPADDPDGRQTVELVAKRTVFTLPEAPAVGLAFIGGGDLFDASGQTRQGEGYSTCTIVKLGLQVPPEVTAHCTSTFRLADGELHLSSLRTYQPGVGGFQEAPMAVVGGTGGYANARGDGKATRQLRGPRQEVAYTFTLNLVTN